MTNKLSLIKFDIH